MLRSVVWQNWWFMVGGVSLLFLGLALFGGSVVRMVFGPGFANHQLAVTLLAGAMLAETACKTPEHGLQAIGKPKLVALVNLVRLALTLVLAAVLVPRGKLAGAALTLVIADISAAILMGAIFINQTTDEEGPEPTSSLTHEHQTT